MDTSPDLLKNWVRPIEIQRKYNIPRATLLQILAQTPEIKCATMPKLHGCYQYRLVNRVSFEAWFEKCCRREEIAA
jgi:hypothetical protein